MSSTAKNLEAIQKALDQHALGCDADVIEIRMCPFEVERLGFDEFKGIPIVEDPKMQSGRFRVVCANDGVDQPELTEAVSKAVPA